MVLCIERRLTRHFFVESKSESFDPEILFIVTRRGKKKKQRRRSDAAHETWSSRISSDGDGM
jgi:hypothetical protein